MVADPVGAEPDSDPTSRKKTGSESQEKPDLDLDLTFENHPDPQP